MDKERPFSRQFRTDYRLVRQLGRGGSGEVLEAVQLNLNRRVAVKLLRAELFADDESRRRLIEEARILARLSHPAVVTLLGASVDGDCPYLVMEFVDGPTLAQLMRKDGPIAVPRALELALEIVSGLSYLHEAAVLHRDLKPENVLMRNGIQPKLADFGLARAPGTVPLTANGFAVGTPMYMAPELLVGGPASPRSDVYAFGMTLYYILTARFPVMPGPGAGLVAEKLGLTRAVLETKMGGIPPSLGHFLVRCLAFEPAERFSGAPEAEAALRAIQATLVPSAGRLPVARPAPGTAAPSTSSAWRRNCRRATAVALALAAACALALLSGLPVRPAVSTEHPARAGKPRGGDPASARTLSAAALPPSTCEFTLGTDRIRLKFPAPLAEQAHFSYRELQGPSLVRKELRAGQAEHLLTGLRPATRYRAEVLSGGPSILLTFTTLNSASRVEDALTGVSAIFDREHAGHRDEQELQGVQLDRADSVTVDADVAVRGHRIAALWRRYRRDVEGTLRFRESRDRGLTWTAVERFSGPELVSAPPRLVWSAAGLLASWTAEVEGETHSFFRLRREGSETWDPVVAVSSRRPGAAVLEAPDGLFDLLLAPPDPARSSFTLHRLPASSPGLPPGLAAFSQPESRFSHLVRAETGLVSFCCDADDLNPEPFVWWSRSSEGRLWSPLRQFTRPGERPQQFCAASAGEVVAGAYRTDSEVRVRVSTDAGVTFGHIVKPLPVGLMGSLPTLTASGRDLYLGCLGYGVSGALGRKSLVLMRSRDGGDWTLLAQWPMWLFDPRGQRIAAGQDQLVAIETDAVRGVLLFLIPLQRER